MAAGTYTNASTLLVSGNRRLIGLGTSPSVVTAVTAGPIFRIDLTSDVAFENLQISGATSASGQGLIGVGIDCPSTPAGTRTLRLSDDVITNNASHGVSAQLCSVYATRTSFSGNGVHGLSATDSNASIERCTASGNQGDGISLDGGLFSLTNTFITRNALGGLAMYTQDVSTDIEFNTIVDNQGVGFDCNTSSVTIGAPNNIIARNQTNAAGSPCTYPSSVVSATVTALHFKSPDAAPYDYHIATGSIAIDMATLSSIDHDFDGDHRPQGAGNDVGADEAQ